MVGKDTTKQTSGTNYTMTYIEGFFFIKVFIDRDTIFGVKLFLQRYSLWRKKYIDQVFIGVSV